MDNTSIPAYVTKYFWGDNIAELDMKKNRKYIVETLLNLGDREALRWVFKEAGRDTIKESLPTLKLDKKSANFWNLYLS